MTSEISARPAVTDGAGAARSASRTVTEADVRDQVGDINVDREAAALVARYLSQHEDPEQVDVEAAYEFALHARAHGPSSRAFLLDLGAWSPGVAATASGLAAWLQGTAGQAGTTILAVYHGVTFVTDPDTGEPEVTSVRLVADVEGARVLEHAVECAACHARNWVVVGTDPGEYRCAGCCGYL